MIFLGRPQTDSKMEGLFNQVFILAALRNEMVTEIEKEIHEHCLLLERSVVSKESRFAVRVMRIFHATRNKMTASNEKLGIMMRIMTIFYPQIHDPQTPQSDQFAPNPLLLPEVDCYIHLIIVIFMMDLGLNLNAENCSNILVEKLGNYNRRSLDHVASRCYFYHTLSHEVMDQLANIRGKLHARLNIANLHNDFQSQGVLINCLLRNYLHYNLYDHANKLVLKETFPEQVSTNSEWARYLYYLGRIKAIRLDYSEAHKHLVQSLRKAHSSAIGFRLTVHKLSITVQLLMGIIPEKNLFLQPDTKEALAPYFELTKAVRTGNLVMLEALQIDHDDQFKADRTFTLIHRLESNVINTAIRRISIAYSRISFVDVAAKLNLGTPMEAEFIIAKARTS